MPDAGRGWQIETCTARADRVGSGDCSGSLDQGSATGALQLGGGGEVVVICHKLPQLTVSSNSIRVGTEIFDSAREAGELMSRSAAQQIEHWARIGAALEACGLTVGQVALLLKSQTEEQGDAGLWAFKRKRQQADLENARSGRVTQDQLSWFSDGKARNLKLINSPY